MKTKPVANPLFLAISQVLAAAGAIALAPAAFAQNQSAEGLEEIIVTARKVEVPIFTVGFSTLPWEDRKKSKEMGFNMAVLQLFADETGGGLFVVQDPDEMKEAVSRISTELRHQYLIGYSPGLARWDGRFRAVQLLARNGRYVVRTRKGYYANP